jgi:uncharacterized membrane protein
MNNKVLFFLFATIILIFVFMGINAIDEIDSSFVDVLQEQMGSIQGIKKVFDGLQGFKEFLYYMSGLAVAIIAAVFMSRRNKKSI